MPNLSKVTELLPQLADFLVYAAIAVVTLIGVIKCRGAIDHNIPLMTNARLAKAFIEAFCEMSMEDIKIKSWQDYK